MRAPKFVLAIVLLVPAVCAGWHHPVHYMITRAAIDSLPEDVRKAFGSEIPALIERYSVYPDLYGFVNDEQRALLRPFCFLPSGRGIHNVTWRTGEDLEALGHLIASISRMLVGHDTRSAAQYAGVLSHFLADSTCPAHALLPLDSSMRTLYRPPAGKSHVELHAVIERSSPTVDITGRKPSLAGNSATAAAESLLARCYAAIRKNRETLEETARAGYAGDEEGMNPARLRAAQAGAELVADGFYTAVRLVKASSPVQ